MKWDQFDWTEERVEALKQHLVEGLSCSLIAARLDPTGGLTRNAVIGKLHRLGLKSGRLPLVRANSVENNDEPEKPKRRKAERSFGWMPFGPKKPKAEPKRSASPKPYRAPIALTAAKPKRRAAPPEAVEPKHLSLLALTSRTCHWPYGDGPFTFCGHDSGGETYCPYHARVSVDRPAFAEAAE